MRLWSLRFRGAALACIAALLTTLAIDPATAAPQRRGSSSQVYLFTGIMGMTAGLEATAEKLRQRNVPTTIAGPNEWYSLAQSAAESYKRGRLRSIIIIGFSMGGGSAMDMASELNEKKVPVRLVVTLDPVGAGKIPPNVRRVVNYYVSSGISGAIPRSPQYRGSLRNVGQQKQNLNHFSLPLAHEREVLNQVIAAARSGGAPSSH
jgi:pimeloyl-ACP methyl ester carboxylesterase